MMNALGAVPLVYAVTYAEQMRTVQVVAVCWEPAMTHVILTLSCYLIRSVYTDMFYTTVRYTMQPLLDYTGLLQWCVTSL